MSRSRKGNFSRDYSEDGSAPSWLNDFAASLHKTSVQSADADRSMFDQISEILGGPKSRYATVDEAVQDFQKRTGLAQYLQMCEAEQAEVTKVAGIGELADMNDADGKLPKLLEEHPEIQSFIENFVRDRKGFIHGPAVIESIRIIFRNENFSSDELEDKYLRKYISDRIMDEKSKHEEKAPPVGDLGKLDYSAHSGEAQDAFAIIMPAK